MVAENVLEVFEKLRGIWKHRWVGLWVAWGVCAVGWATVLVLPNKYESSARVYVDTRTPLRRVIDSRIGVEQDVTSEIDMVRQAMLSRPQLEKVARLANLDTKVRSPGDMDGVVAGLRSGITIDRDAGKLADPSRDTGSALYTITYRNSDRGKSLKVVSSLLDSFVEDTLGNKRTGSDVAQSFLRGQLKDYQRRLSEAEAALAEFRKKNFGLIPGGNGDFFTRLDRENVGLQDKQTQLAVAYSRQSQLRRQLNTTRTYIPGTSAAGGAMGAPSDLSVRLQEAEAKLEDLLLRYTDKHPEVVALRSTIAELKAREQREMQDINRGGAGSGAIRSLNANPVYQNIQLQLNQTEVEIASLQGAIAQHQREIANLKRSVDTAPEVERELARLTRDYGVTKTQYESLLQRFEQTKVSDDAQQTGIVKFEILDPPLATTAPVWPDRPLLMAGVLFGGALAGALVAFLMSLLVPTFTNTRALTAITGVNVLGHVSLFPQDATDLAVAADRRRFVMLSAGLAAAGVVMLLGGSMAARLLQRLVS